MDDTRYCATVRLLYIGAELFPATLRMFLPGIYLTTTVLNDQKVVICLGDRGHVLVTEFRGTTLNGLSCADVLVLRPLDLIPLTDFTRKYHPCRQGG